MKSAYLFFEGTASRRNPVAARMADTRVAHVASEQLDHGAFFHSLLSQAALHAPNYRSRSLNRRMAACLRVLGVTTADDGLAKIRDKPELAETALNTVLLGVTEFFRDPLVFENLRFLVLPWLLSQHQNLRIWSAACSEGQELYSIAMLLAEDGRLEHCELLGTDCRGEAIKQARAGIFSAEEVGRLANHWRKNFFEQTAVSARIDPRLAKTVRWETADLFAGVEPGPWHLLLWRNMAIYLEPSAAETIWNRICVELAPGGYLVTGKADHPPAGLPLKRVATCIYKKTSAS